MMQSTIETNRRGQNRISTNSINTTGASLSSSSKSSQTMTTKSIIWILMLVGYMMVSRTQACDPWRASDCQGAPTTAEEEIMKNDDYTKEQLYKYCDKGKAYVDCVNAKLKCCDLKPEMRGTVQAQEKNLQKVAWKLGPYCAGLGESNVINYKCRTTTKATTSTSTKSTKPTMPPCPIEKAGEECSHYLDGRVKFEESWNVYDKMQWCRDTIDYVNCANQYLLNCNISSLKNEADQLQSFIDYVTKSSNVHCPGGINGCEDNTNDIRCRLGIRYFIGEFNTNRAAAASSPPYSFVLITSDRFPRLTFFLFYSFLIIMSFALLNQNSNSCFL